MEPDADYIDQELERRLRVIEDSTSEDPARQDLGVRDMLTLAAIVLVVVLLSLLWGFSG